MSEMWKKTKITKGDYIYESEIHFKDIPNPDSISKMMVESEKQHTATGLETVLKMCVGGLVFYGGLKLLEGLTNDDDIKKIS